MTRVCALTNVYNESFNLPIWLRHYGRQVGIENCIVVDHGSDDGSTRELGGASRLRLPRSPFDDCARADFISSLANSLLGSYDWVLYSDCDELLVADPRKHASLVELCERASGPAITARGVDVLHHLANDAPLREDQPILSQRGHVQFLSAMCKTLLVRQPVSWGGGFHSSNFAPTFGDLYLFHLRSVDLGESMRRLATTRNVAFVDEGAGLHHRASFVEHVRRYLWFSSLTATTDDFTFDDEVQMFLARAELTHTNRYYVQEQFISKVLRTVPTEFRSVI